MKIAFGGAAGYFSAINAAELNPDLEVVILEGNIPAAPVILP